MTMESERLRCTVCGHDSTVHFAETDSMGWFSFCMLASCECFQSTKKEEEE